jgi:hypothetical protein
MDFQISSERIQRRVPVTVLHLSGSLNLGSAEAFEQAARQAVEQGARYVLLDMKDVPAVRSAGLRSVQILYNMLNPKAAGSPPAGNPVPSPYLKAVSLSPDVHYVFDVAGFLGNISCYDDMETALNSFG